MSGPAGGGPPGCLAGCAPAAVGVVVLAVRVFAGRPGQVGQARAWVRAEVAVTCPALAGDAALITSELAANAITHTRSGQPGGTFTVVVGAAAGGVVIHVHDQGTGSGQLPLLRPAAGRDELAGGGRGLVIVAALATAWGTCPATRCQASPPRNSAADEGGCCTRCQLPTPQEAPAPQEAPTPLVRAPALGAGARLADAGRAEVRRDQD